MSKGKDLIVFVSRSYVGGPVTVAFGSPNGESLSICNSVAEKLGIGVKFVEDDGEPVWTPFRLTLEEGVMETKCTFPAPNSVLIKKKPKKAPKRRRRTSRLSR